MKLQRKEHDQNTICWKLVSWLDHVQRMKDSRSVTQALRWITDERKIALSCEMARRDWQWSVMDCQMPGRRRSKGKVMISYACTPFATCLTMVVLVRRIR